MSNKQKAEGILKLYENLKTKFIDITHSQYAIPALDAFFKKPIINTSDFIKTSGIKNKVTASDLLRKLVKNYVIKILLAGRGSKPSIYILPDLLNIAEGRKLL